MVALGIQTTTRDVRPDEDPQVNPLGPMCDQANLKRTDPVRHLPVTRDTPARNPVTALVHFTIARQGDRQDLINVADCLDPVVRIGNDQKIRLGIHLSWLSILALRLTSFG